MKYAPDGIKPYEVGSVFLLRYSNAFRGIVEGFQEIVSDRQGEEGIMKISFCNPGNLPK